MLASSKPSLAGGGRKYFMQITRAIVTGGSGFIGSHLVDALVEQGVDVTVVDFAEPKYRNEKAAYINHDIRQDGLNEIFSNLKPEVVFHLAAHLDDRQSLIDPANNAEHNVLGSLKVFEAARLAHVQKIVFASSCAVYGQPERLPIRETATPKPLTPYGVSKLTGEKYLDVYKSKYGIAYVAFRIGNVYGERQDGSKESGAIAIFTKKLLAGEQAFINDTGETVRDYIHVSDVVAAFIAGAQADKVGIYNCGTKRGTTTMDVYTQVKAAAKRDAQPLARPEVKDEVKNIHLNIRLAKQELGWKPKVKLSKGIKNTVKWYKDKA